MSSLNNLPNISKCKPTYSIKLPTTGENIEYQSYTKNEEKTILIASHEKDYSTLISTLNNLLESHCTGQITTVTDFIYILIHIRAKSHGEGHTFTLKKCKCGKENIQIKVDNILNCIKIKNADKQKNTYQITDKVSLRLCPTKIDMLKEIKFDDTPENAIDQVYNMISNSISYVVNDQDIIKDFTTEQLIKNIINHLSPKQIEEINEMIGEMVHIIFDVEYFCAGCRETHKIEMNDFLF